MYWNDVVLSARQAGSQCSLGRTLNDSSYSYLRCQFDRRSDSPSKGYRGCSPGSAAWTIVGTMSTFETRRRSTLPGGMNPGADIANGTSVEGRYGIRLPTR